MPLRGGKLRLHQGGDVDSVDPQALDLAADVHVDQGGIADRDPGQVNQLEARVGEVDVMEPGTGQVHVLELSAGQVLASELGHPSSLTPQPGGVRS